MDAFSATLASLNEESLSKMFTIARGLIDHYRAQHEWERVESCYMLYAKLLTERAIRDAEAREGRVRVLSEIQEVTADEHVERVRSGPVGDQGLPWFQD